MSRQHQAGNGKKAGGDNARSSYRTCDDLIAYKNVNDLPPPREMAIHVDERNEAIILPVYGSMVPFHVANIKKVCFLEDTSTNCHILIKFNVLKTPHETTSLKNESEFFLKEVSFRSRDPRHISEVIQQIKTLKRNMMSRSLVIQEKLVLAGNKFKPIRLTDILIRPVCGGQGGKLPGSLEAHVNGFRYSNSQSDKRVDILFGNIKHAFFQAAEKEMFTLLHFCLRNHIMVGNKKTKDVQFYVEVMDRDRKNKINMDFQSFVNQVNELWSELVVDLEFDRPLNDFGFHGVPEIEIVNLERVRPGQKNFDMAIVFKEFNKEVIRIDSIPSTSLDGIRKWLDTTDIKYYETRFNMKWREILKTIAEDPRNFFDEGGWEFLNLEMSDSDSDGLQESDQDVEPESELED
ncbi:hypothetical protein L2E82_49067 [Cichorium intybus]|uniref:Uncharacterized protein n=1 Tax=Cichorium intybus TaxID=13427 RepID=A0ACB8Z071_CICIN|nr:hypothetical protein L2E82_49067 [Cichorium intybus]